MTVLRSIVNGALSDASDVNQYKALYQGGHVFDVKYGYGALGDGSTDDTAAIQAAITAANAAGGGTVFFPPGTYIVKPSLSTTWLIIYSNITFRGCGWASIIKVANSTGDYEKLFSGTTSTTSLSNVTWEDLTFDQNPTGNSTQQPGNTTSILANVIQVFAGSKFRVSRCNFASCCGVNTIRFSQQVATTLSDIQITGCYFNFLMRAAATDYDNSTIYVEASNYQMIGNHFETTYVSGRGARGAMEAHAGPCVVSNNVVVDHQVGVNVVAPVNAAGSPDGQVISGNTFERVNWGVNIWPTTYGMKGLVVSNNSIYCNQVDQNVSSGGTAWGIGSPVILGSTPGALSDFAITGNTIRFQDCGAGLSNGSRNGICLLHGGGGGETTGASSNGLIANNVIELAPTRGISMAQGGGTASYRNIQILGNVLVNPGQDLACTFTREGIFLVGTLTDIRVEGNQISDTFATTRCTNAIRVFTGGSQTRVRIRNNHISSATTPLVIDVLQAGVSTEVESIPYAASITPDAATADTKQVGTLTGAITVAAPTNPTTGQRLTFRFLHDNTASVYAITWNAIFKRAGGAFANTNTANAVDTITYQFSGTNWEEVARTVNLS